MKWLIAIGLMFSFLTILAILHLLLRHLVYQCSCDKMGGTYGEYAYFKGTYGWGHYKLYFSRKKNILGVKLWGEAVQFGDTRTITDCDERMTPDSFNYWAETSLQSYETHLKSWGKV